MGDKKVPANGIRGDSGLHLQASACGRHFCHQGSEVREVGQPHRLTPPVHFRTRPFFISGEVRSAQTVSEKSKKKNQMLQDFEGNI